ncbi:MAG: T9SS type A sorting domain-containing protein [Candidatus Latescibacterota bacterium]|nr:MAG: T9SS type A sorting domain-containing protein [Candidatus Latescibacterota bacterium]
MKRPWGFLTIGLLLTALSPPTLAHASDPSKQNVRLIDVRAVEDVPRNRVYIQGDTPDEQRLLEVRRQLMDAGATHVNLFLPYGVIVCDSPESLDIERLIGDPRFSVIEESRLDLRSSAGQSEDLDLVRRCYRQVAGPVSEQPPSIPHESFDDVVLTVPTEVVRESKRRAELSAAPGAVPERNIQQNAEFLVGDVLIQLVLPESDGHSEDWTEEAMASAISASFAGAIAFQERFHYAPLDFILKTERLVPTTYEPIQTTMGEHWQWVQEVLIYLGIPLMKTDLDMVHEYNNRGRNYYATDWAYTAFVCSSENAPNHRFADQFYTAYANLGGPYLVMPHPAGENPYEIDPWLVYSTVYQHEMCHIFWALDEYPGPNNLTQCSSHAGYLDYMNLNKVTELFDGTLEGCMGRDPELCTMWRAKEDLGRPICPYTAGQLGIIDNNSDNIPDVFAAPPTLRFETARVETVNTPDITVGMKAISQAVPNINPAQTPDERVSYAPPLRSAALTVNGVGPVHLEPLDGRWDEAEEDLSLSINGIPVGMTQIEVVVMSAFGKLSPPIIKQIYFAGIKYALFDIDVRERGIYVSWNTVGETFGARLDLHRIDSTSGAPDTTVLVTDIQPKEHRNQFHFYEYLDSDVKPGRDYRYFVRGYFEIDYGDRIVEYEASSETFKARGMFPISAGSLVSNVSPNPFRGSAQISVRVPPSYKTSEGDPGSSSSGISIPERTDVLIDVYDVKGRLVRKVYRGRLFAGVETFTWDGTNAKNERVPSGIYFIKIAAGAATEVKKVVIVR